MKNSETLADDLNKTLKTATQNVENALRIFQRLVRIEGSGQMRRKLTQDKIELSQILKMIDNLDVKWIKAEYAKQAAESEAEQYKKRALQKKRPRKSKK